MRGQVRRTLDRLLNCIRDLMENVMKVMLVDDDAELMREWEAALATIGEPVIEVELVDDPAQLIDDLEKRRQRSPRSCGTRSIRAFETQAVDSEERWNLISGCFSPHRNAADHSAPLSPVC